MKYRRIDNNGDYSFGRSNQDFLIDIFAVAQAVRTKLLLLQGEWWEDIQEGLPLFQHILGANGSQESLDGADLLIQDRILNTPGVKSIKEYSRTFNNRSYSLICSIETVFGDTLINEVF